jgi:methylmalonyl-CoA epimerase
MRIDHIGIVVRDIHEALNVYEAALGLPLREVVDVPDDKVRVAFLPVGESNVELVQPVIDDTGTARFLEKHGEGVHHICIEVADLDQTLNRLKESGVALIDEVPRRGAHGRVAFVHPRGAHGVLVELVEHETSGGPGPGTREHR